MTALKWDSLMQRRCGLSPFSTLAPVVSAQIKWVTHFAAPTIKSPSCHWPPAPRRWQQCDFLTAERTNTAESVLLRLLLCFPCPPSGAFYRLLMFIALSPMRHVGWRRRRRMAGHPRCTGIREEKHFLLTGSGCDWLWPQLSVCVQQKPKTTLRQRNTTLCISNFFSDTCTLSISSTKPVVCPENPAFLHCLFSHQTQHFCWVSVHTMNANFWEDQPPELWLP